MSENNDVKRAVISYDNMSPELLDAFKEKYPHGYADYLGEIRRIDKPSGESLFVVPLEVPGAIYMVKIKVNIDKEKDVESELFKDSEEDDGSDNEGGDFPVNDDDLSGAGADDPDEMAGDE